MSSDVKMTLFASVAVAFICVQMSASSPSAHAFTYPSPFCTKYAMKQPPPLLMRKLPRTCRGESTFRTLNILQMAPTDEDLEKEISQMKAKDIRAELQSYGVSTKSFFEKSELVDALVQARKEGKTPIVNGETTSTYSANAAESSESSANASGATTASADSGSRQEKIQKEMEKCKSLKVGELKKELESYGVSTKSFFEKSEFVRAVAEARVDGVKKDTTKSAGKRGGGWGSAASGGSSAKEEPRDPSYRDVIVSKFRGDKNLMEGKIIDVRAR